MPLFFAFFSILFIEALTFWAFASWIGVGWTIFLLFALMGVGLMSAGIEMQRVGRLAAAEKISAGRLAGDYGLLTVGSILAGTPGIASSIAGLLLIFPPTRALARRMVAARFVASIEEFGVRSFEVTNARRTPPSYGSFTDPDAPQTQPQPEPSHEVIDESEIEEWTRRVRPEDFGDAPEDRR